ncbi:MAG: hypothetical protein ACYDD1_00140 [Caulobacteraceae bacterium]
MTVVTTFFDIKVAQTHKAPTSDDLTASQRTGALIMLGLYTVTVAAGWVCLAVSFS